MAPVLINLIIFALLLIGLARLQGGNLSLSARVFIGLILGTLFGIGLAFYATPSTDAALSSLPAAQAGAAGGGSSRSAAGSHLSKKRSTLPMRCGSGAGIAGKSLPCGWLRRC